MLSPSITVENIVLSEESIPIDLFGMFDTRVDKASGEEINAFRGWACYYNRDKDAFFTTNGVIEHAQSLSDIHGERLGRKISVMQTHQSLSDEHADRAQKRRKEGFEVMSGSWAIQLRNNTLVNYGKLSQQEKRMLNVRDVGMNGLSEGGQVMTLRADPEITRRLAAVNPNADSWII